jgi:hypothetical protein
LATALDQPVGADGVEMRADGQQWYLTAPLRNSHVTLQQIERAFQGSPFSVRQDRLRFFGHFILEIDARGADQSVRASLESLKYLNVVETRTAKGLLIATVEAPYPTHHSHSNRDVLGTDTYIWNDLSSTGVRSEKPATADLLPSLGRIRDLLAKDRASVRAVRWSSEFACRRLGCVAVPEQPNRTPVVANQPQ